MSGRICYVDYKPPMESGHHQVSLLKITEDCEHGVILYKKEFIKVKLADVSFRSME